MSVTIWWIRRDLRLADNQALAAAVDRGSEVIPLWISDPRLLESPYVGQKRLAFLYAGLRALDDALRERGSRLVVRRGDPVDVLQQLLAETGASAVFSEADYSPYARRRDNRVCQQVPLFLVEGLAVQPPGSVMKQDGDPYVVYTPFRNRWLALSRPTAADLLPAPSHIETPEVLDGEEIPATPRLTTAIPFAAGEAQAERRLHSFLAGPIDDYAQARDRLDLEATSELSPYLRFGMISARRVAVAGQEALTNAQNDEAAAGAGAWRDELIWRDFYIHVLYHFPEVRKHSFRERYRQLPWRHDKKQLEAWQNGYTGYPVVDASMRQMAHSGWMHNRGRMIVASFLSKHLLLPWQWGEKWFMQQLIDGDPAANNGGWQWAAGTGTDAAPYFRIFNPVAQGKKHDPQGDYVRRWLPELARVPVRYLHSPWQMPSQVQREAQCRIGEDYPEPIVQHKPARERALEAYKSLT